MREEDSNWFSRWEEDLPSPDELMPLSQTLITPDLALAFDIPPNRSPNSNSPISQTLITPDLGLSFDVTTPNSTNSSSPRRGVPVPPLTPSPTEPHSSEFDSTELGSCVGGGDEPARTLKRPRLVWTPQLHKRFVDAVGHLGIKNAVPKTIMQLMSVEGLTRENVASHLQKYRLYLKRMQGLSSGGSGGGGGGSDAATDHLMGAPISAHPGSFIEDLESANGGGGGRKVLTLFPTGDD
ncbi:hypothetical protein GIB67_016908 [Kingdonia uniflora]|uniref:HTH myb-type domain-containing protein n=1 Tax=Kingdonia uniflora TaxID=39325 RepID=A0A7J7M3G3_9MAGN|nr:hypothetical protein GIB67_016908 [Kingdonia uniflora]